MLLATMGDPGGVGMLRPGATLGPFTLERLLGEGGTGIVFQARKGPGEGPVALKVLKGRYLADDEHRRRFEHEFRAAREVRHPHLVGCLEAGEIDGWLYIVQGYVAGVSLAARLESRGPLDLHGILGIAEDVGGALQALHDAGLVHRDVKPSNILLDGDERAYLSDFTLVKGPRYTALTRQGQMVGTVEYLAPERLRGQQASGASDIYAFGCVIYECIVGHPPFHGMGLIQLGMAHLNEEPSDPCLERPELPARLSRPVLEALAKDPAKRPPSATVFVDLLRMAAGDRAGT